MLFILFIVRIVSCCCCCCCWRERFLCFVEDAQCHRHYCRWNHYFHFDLFTSYLCHPPKSSTFACAASNDSEIPNAAQKKREKRTLVSYEKCSIACVWAMAWAMQKMIKAKYMVNTCNFLVPFSIDFRFFSLSFARICRFRFGVVVVVGFFRVSWPRWDTKLATSCCNCYFFGGSFINVYLFGYPRLSRSQPLIDCDWQRGPWKEHQNIHALIFVHLFCGQN